MVLRGCLCSLIAMNSHFQSMPFFEEDRLTWMWCVSDLVSQNQSMSSSPPEKNTLASPQVHLLYIPFTLFPYNILFRDCICILSWKPTLWVFAVLSSVTISDLDCIRITKGAFTKYAGLTYPHPLLQRISEWSVDCMYFEKSSQMFLIFRTILNN